MHSYLVKFYDAGNDYLTESHQMADTEDQAYDKALSALDFPTRRRVRRYHVNYVATNAS